MNKYNILARQAVFVLVYIVILLFGAIQSMAFDSKVLPQNAAYSILSSVQAMYQGEYSRSGPFITVFEIGGGDPAMNGAFIYLRIVYNERSFVWKTWLNVRSVKQLSFLPNNVILLRVDEDVMDSNHSITQRSAIYKISFAIDKDDLMDIINVELYKQD